MTSLFSLAAGFGGQMKIVKAYSGLSAYQSSSSSVTVPALTGSQMAVFIVNVWGGPSGAITNARGFGGYVNFSGTNLDGASSIYAAGGTSGSGAAPGFAAPTAFITTSTGNQNITVQAINIYQQGSEYVGWNGIMCIYNPPF